VESSLFKGIHILSHICFKASRGEVKHCNRWALQAGVHLHGARIRSSRLGNRIPRGWYVHLLMRSAQRKADTSGLARSSSGVQDWVLLTSAVPCAVYGSYGCIFRDFWRLRCGIATLWKCIKRVGSYLFRALKWGHWQDYSVNIYGTAIISLSEGTITYSLFFSQLLTPSLSTPRIACWRMNRVLPLPHMAVLQTAPLPT